MASASSGGSGPSSAPLTPVPSNYNLFYYSLNQATYTSDQMLALFGIDVRVIDLSLLNFRDFYPVNETTPSFDNYLYVATPGYTVDDQYADQTWTYTPRPLDIAKANGSWEAKTTANNAVNMTACDCGFTTDLLTAVASQDPMVRPLRYQAELDEMTAISNQLDSDLTAIEAATTVDEINAIVHKPYGVINTGRGGPGQAGPRDLNLSYFTEVNDLPGFTQADLELYVPGTNTVISYTDSLPEPFHFDSAGNCFNTGDWRLVIRYAGGGAVISTITVPQGANVDVPWDYNPNIPSSGSSSSSQK